MLLLIIYFGRETLSPFIVAAIFAYLLNPLVTLLAGKFKLSRTVSILIVYLGILTTTFTLGIYLGRQLILESQDFAHRIELGDLSHSLPSWFLPYFSEAVVSFRSSVNFSSQQAVRVLSGTIASITSTFVFLIALFYFLKDGGIFIKSLEDSLPTNIKKEFLAVIEKIRNVLSNYLRAQLFLVLLMTFVGSILFSLLGVRYALILGTIIGLAEIIPIIGPIFAFISILTVTAIGGGIGNLFMDPVIEIILAGLVYIFLNQLENILVVPQVTGRMVELHPLLILASVLIGGQLFGAVGFLLAVPVVASGKVLANHLHNLVQ